MNRKKIVSFVMALTIVAAGLGMGLGTVGMQASAKKASSKKVVTYYYDSGYMMGSMYKNASKSKKTSLVYKMQYKGKKVTTWGSFTKSKKGSKKTSHLSSKKKVFVLDKNVEFVTGTKDTGYIDSSKADFKTFVKEGGHGFTFTVKKGKVIQIAVAQ